MSIDRLAQCACGHSVNDHEAGGCRGNSRGGRVLDHCACPLSRADSIDRIIETERTALQDRWRDIASPRTP